MAKRPLTIVDNGFLITETKESPKHIAGMQTYKLPARASKNFVKKLYESWVTVDTVCAPYNLILNAKNPLAPCWDEAKNFKAKDHVFFLSLKEGTDAELNALVSALHEPRLDLTKPLWRCFFIDRKSVV